MRYGKNAAMSGLLYDECLDCGEVIYNPLCHECISKEFEQWISEYPEIKREITVNVKRFVSSQKDYDDYQRCVSCGKRNVHTCPYCFTDYLLKLLKEANASKKIISEFLLLFNFDFEHNGYYKEGEELGVF